MSELLLGKGVEYKSSYDNSLLFPIKRSMGRQRLRINEELPFNGYDIWNCYEVSWLGLKGKPEVRIMHFIVPANSPCLIESKSLKLYLNSFNNSRFASEEEIYNLLRADLSRAAGLPIEIHINRLDYYKNAPLGLFEGILLDDEEAEISEYEVNHDLLQLEADAGEGTVEETLCSNLLKSNCLVTGQPDWASIEIRYKGRKINRPFMLRYLVSYRNHNGFHEECVENIFIDIMRACRPKELTVFAKYTRRGGIDINPFRTTLDLKNTGANKMRDARQ